MDIPSVHSAAEAKVRVQQEIRDGSDDIKIVANSIEQGTIVTMPEPVATAIVEEAHKRGRLVFAHVSNGEKVTGTVTNTYGEEQISEGSAKGDDVNFVINANGGRFKIIKGKITGKTSSSMSPSANSEKAIYWQNAHPKLFPNCPLFGQLSRGLIAAGGRATWRKVLSPSSNNPKSPDKPGSRPPAGLGDKRPPLLRVARFASSGPAKLPAHVDAL